MMAYGNALKATTTDYKDLITLTGNLTLEQTKNVLSSKGLNEETIKTVLASRNLSVAEAQATAATIAKTGTTTTATLSTGAYTAALWENTKALLTSIKLNPLTWILGIGAAIGLVVHLYKEWDVTIEEQKEHLKELKNEYENTIQELTALGDEIEKNTIRLNELRDKQDNGTITLIENDELKKLSLANKLLEEQKQNKEYIAKQNAKEISEGNQETFKDEWGSDFETEYNTEGNVYHGYAAQMSDSNISSSLDKDILLNLKSVNEQLDAAIADGDESLVKSLQKRQEKLKAELNERSDTILEGFLEQQNTLMLLRNEDGDFDDIEDQQLWNDIESWKKEIYQQTGRSGEWNTIQLDVALNDISLNSVKEEINQKIANGTLTETDILQYDNLITSLEKSNLILDEGETVASVYLDYLNKIAVSQEQVDNTVPDFAFNDSNSGIIDSYQSDVTALSEALDKVRNNTLTDSDKIDLFQDFPMLEEQTDNLGKGIQRLIDDKLSILRTSLRAAGASDEILSLFDNIATESKNLSLDDVLSDLDNTNSMIKTVESEVKESGKISVSTLQNISSQYPLLSKHVDDYLNQKISEEELIEVLQGQYETDLQNYRVYMSQKMGDDEEFYTNIAEALSDDLVNKAKQYGLDLKNYTTYSKAKLAIDKTYVEKRDQLEKATNAFGQIAEAVDSGQPANLNAMKVGQRKVQLEKEVVDLEGIMDEFDSTVDGIVANFETPDFSFGSDDESKKETEEFSEQIDWFARAIENATRKVSELDTELSNTDGFTERLAVLEKLKEANQELVDATAEASEEYKDIWDIAAAKLEPEYVNLITSSDNGAEENYTEAVKKRKSKYKGSKFAGNVDLYNRPILLDDEGYYETLKSETFNYSDFGINKKGAFNVTPILPDGTKIDDLGKYILKQLKDGKAIEDLDIFMGGDYSTIDEAVEAAIALHEEQDVIYGAEAEYLRLLKEGKDLNLSIEDFDNEEEYNNYMKAIEAYDKYQDSVEANKAAVAEQQEYEDTKNGILLEQTELALELHDLENQDTMTVKERNQWLDEEKRLKGEILKYNLLLATTEEERLKFQKDYDEYVVGEEGRKYEVAKEGRSNRASYYESRIQDVDNKIALTEARGGQPTEAQYLESNALREKLGDIYQADYDAALEKREGETKGTAEYKKYNDELQEAQDNLNANKIAQIENNRAMLKLPLKKLEEENKLLEENLALRNKELEKIESAMGYANMLVQDRIDALNEEKEATTKAYEDQIKAIEEQKKVLTDSNDEREREINLENAKYELEKAIRNRTQRIYRKGEGFVYEQDQEAVRNAQNDLDQQQFDNTIADLDKQIDVLNTSKENDIELIDAEIKTWEDYAKKLDDVSNSYERLISKRNFFELFGGEEGEAAILSKDMGMLTTLQGALNTAQLEVDTIQEKIDANNLTIQKINEEADGYLATTKQVKEAQDAINKLIVDNEAELLGIQARSDKTGAMAKAWTDADTEIETALDLIDTAQTTANEAEGLVLDERKLQLEQFRDAAILLYKEIAKEVTKANLAFTSLETTLTKAQEAYKAILGLANSATDVEITVTSRFPEMRTFHSGGIVGKDNKLPENFMALTSANLKPNETLAKLLNGEVVLNNNQMENMVDNLNRAYSSILPTTLNKRENTPINNISIGDVNVYNPDNSDMIVDEIVKELPLKVMQRLNSK